MTKPSNLNAHTDFYYQGFKLSLDNSISLQKVAELSATNSEFGIACSLNILAAEEAVKANFILIRHYNPDVEINDFKEVFRKHSVKHDHLKGIAAVQEVQIKRFRSDLEVFDKLLDIVEQMPDGIKQKTLEGFSTWYEIKDWVKKFEDQKLTSEEIATWADKANNDKNNGFYVDLRGGRWTSPKSFSKEKYMQESKYTTAIIGYVIETEKVFLELSRLMAKTPS